MKDKEGEELCEVNEWMSKNESVTGEQEALSIPQVSCHLPSAYQKPHSSCMSLEVFT